MGLDDMPMDDWKIRSAEGREYAFDDEEEARQALPEYGPGATLWKRRAYRGLLHLTMSPGGWQQVEG